MTGFFAAGLLLVFAVAAVVLIRSRKLNLRGLSILKQHRFLCRIEQLTADAPAGKDQFFNVQMIGRIPTPHDDYLTDVKIEITDITDGLKSPEPVLSTDQRFQSGKDSIFHFQVPNGAVPKRNSVLARWITIAQIPCHCLRFACRGRRRLLFAVSILSAETGKIVCIAQQTLDYVNCGNGFRELQKRKLEILQSSLLVTALACTEDTSVSSTAKNVMLQWLDFRAEAFPPAASLKQFIADIEGPMAALNLTAAADRLLAWGDLADKEAAIELLLTATASSGYITAQRFMLIKDAAERFGFAGSNFLSLTQKIYCAANVRMEDPSPLLGIDPLMSSEQIIKRLNEEYRKWNSRVTHPDPDIRRQADSMLNLIAELRTVQLNKA